MIGEKIKALRKSKHLTQVELSKKLGTTQPVLQKWETGIKNPSLKTLKKLSKIFDVSLDTLAFEEKDIHHLSTEDKTIISQMKDFEKLDDKGKETILNMINLLTAKQEKKA